MWTRRDVLKAMGGTAATITAAPYILRRAHAQRPLRVGAFGGIFQEHYQKFIVDPFVEQTGIETELVPIGNVPNLLKLRQLVEMGQEPPIDITIHTTEALPKGVEMGIYTSFPPDAVPRAQHLYPQLRTQADGQYYGFGIGGWYQGVDILESVLEDQQPFSSENPSYAEIYWNAAFENNCMISGTVTDAYLPWIAAETFFGGQEILRDEEGLREVFDKIGEVAPQVKSTWDQEVNGQRAIKQEEIALLQMWNDVSIVMLDRDVPIRRIWPKEGDPIDHGEWVVIKTSPKAEEAAQFIDYSLRADVQTSLSEGLKTMPTVDDHNLEGKFAEQAFAEDIGGSLDQALEIDWTPYFEHEELFQRLWNEFLTTV